MKLFVIVQHLFRLFVERLWILWRIRKGLYYFILDERGNPTIDEAFEQVERSGRQAESPEMGGPPPGFEGRSPRNVGQIDVHMQAVAGEGA